MSGSATDSPAKGLAVPFQSAARAADEAEKSFRASFRPRLEALERERVFAYRRMNLVADMAGEAAQHTTREIAVAAVIHLVATAFALERGRDRHEAVISALAPVARAVTFTIHPLPEADKPVPDLGAALAAFEAWYLAETGAHFLARADIAVADTPVTDW